MNLLAALAELAQALALLGDAEHAPGVYQRLLPYADRNIVNARGASGYGSAAHHLGVLAALCGRRGAAAAHFEHALARNAAMNARPWLARTLRAYGELLAATGEPERGRAMLAHAAATAGHARV